MIEEIEEIERLRQVVAELEEELDRLTADGPVCPSCGRRRKAHARTSDPSTSKEAADKLGDDNIAMDLLAYVADQPDGCIDPVAVMVTGKDGGWRRMSDLRTHGFIRFTDRKEINPATGRSCLVSVVTIKGRERLGRRKRG